MLSQNTRQAIFAVALKMQSSSRLYDIIANRRSLHLTTRVSTTRNSYICDEVLAIKTINPQCRNITTISKNKQNCTFVSNIKFVSTSCVEYSNRDETIDKINVYQDNKVDKSEQHVERNQEGKKLVPRVAYIRNQETAEDRMCNNFIDSDNNINVNEFLSALSATGLDYKTDIRLKEFKLALQKYGWKYGTMPANEFKIAMKPNVQIIHRALTDQLVIPDWQTFTSKLTEMFDKCKIIRDGTVASYIPTLARCSPHFWGLSVCSVDGQRFELGDSQQPFTIQSVSKPVNYAIALNELGQLTHEYVSQEPSGKLFNDLSLKVFEDGHRPKPHNPMVNSGAIVICSLLKRLIHPEMSSSDKFDWICQRYKSMLGGDHYFGFSTATFLAERETADRNYAIAYYLRENKCFPANINLQAVMDLYFQLCSLEVTTNSLSRIASVFANGGVNLEERQCLDSLSVRRVLSLCHSCGMYDYSGQFAFDVGLPAKSGVSGCAILIVPNVAGFALYSPPLDSYGNSVRSLAFSRALVEHFNFHQYENLRHSPHKSDPRRKKYETLSLDIIRLLFAAARGDLSAIRRYYMSGLDMSLTDYDDRCALHAAAAEGHADIVDFLLNKCSLPTHEPRDRWGRRPIDDAIYAGHQKVVDLLESWNRQ